MPRIVRNYVAHNRPTRYKLHFWLFCMLTKCAEAQENGGCVVRCLDFFKKLNLRVRTLKHCLVLGHFLSVCTPIGRRRNIHSGHAVRPSVRPSVRDWPEPLTHNELAIDFQVVNFAILLLAL